MSDQDKSRDELITELLDARLRIAQMERASMGLKRSRSDLEEIKEQFIAQFEAMPIPSYTWEWNGYDFLLVDYNESAEEITRGEIIRFRGTTASELYHDNREIVDDLTTCLKEERSSRREMTYRLKTTGEEKYLSLTYALVPTRSKNKVKSLHYLSPLGPLRLLSSWSQQAELEQPPYQFQIKFP